MLRSAPTPFHERVLGSIPGHGVNDLARFDSAVLHRLVLLGDPEVAIG